MNLTDGLLALFASCQGLQYSLNLEYVSGKYVSGEDCIDESGKLIPLDKIDKSKIKQGESGWRINIAGYSYNNEDGSKMLYKELNQAVGAGLQLISQILRETHFDE